ncbi:MAG: hypothetical protein ACJAS3_000795 [Roseivirga sp.]|jgi:hypothetical protein
MGQRDDLYKLEGMIEFNEAYVLISTPEEPQKALKRGRGSQKKRAVAVMAESTILESPETDEQEKHVRYFNMKMMQDYKAEGVDGLLQGSLVGKNIVFSDKSTSYVNIADYVDVHISVVSDQQVAQNTLKWVHIAISNLKCNLLEVYHKIKGEFLQSYLNEFVTNSMEGTLGRESLIDLLLPLFMPTRTLTDKQKEE